MKKIGILFIFAVCSASCLLAQERYDYQIQPGQLINKEVIFKGPFASEDIKVKLGIKWLEAENRIQLVFERKEAGVSDTYLLFPLTKKNRRISGVSDFQSREKPLWTNKERKELKTMTYFLHSNNLAIDYFDNSYKSLVDNKTEEFSFLIKNAAKELDITLDGLYVAKIVERPWYSLSKRNMNIEYKVKPITIHIVLEQKRPAVSTPAPECTLSENELSTYNTKLKNLQMQINVKKKEGKSTADELKEYQSIKAAVNAKLTQECRRRYANLVSAYENYCKIIDGLF